jgi:lipopolysaccharide/colanic/teichoic acid biosynthesis glycosyltransferase
MFLKRLFDILFSLLILIIIFPFCLPLIILLKFSGEGKIFYIQDRVGRHKATFGLIKFATMLENSSNLPGGDVTTANDPRVLPMGKFLRKTKINELPQFINILKGDMSVVGPRPTTFKNYSYYSDDIQFKIWNLKPGITGIGSIVFRDEEYFLRQSKKDAITCYKEDIAPYKGELEVWYAERRNFILDISLIFVTIIVVLFSKNKILTILYKDLPKHNFFLKY